MNESTHLIDPKAVEKTLCGKQVADVPKKVAVGDPATGLCQECLDEWWERYVQVETKP